jgi:hypothetical protein
MKTEKRPEQSNETMQGQENRALVSLDAPKK